MDKVTVLKRLLRAVQVAGVTIKCLYADTAFCSIPVLRFLLIGVALLIVNMWIRLHWLFLHLRGRGPRRVARWRFRFERMRGFLTRAIERFYGVVTVVDPAPI